MLTTNKQPRTAYEYGYWRAVNGEPRPERKATKWSRDWHTGYDAGRTFLNLWITAPHANQPSGNN